MTSSRTANSIADSILGPLLAPIIGGVLGEALGWRATQWALAVFGILVWTMIFFALPETLKARKDFAAEAAVENTNTHRRPQLSRTSTREAVQQRSKQYAKILRMMFLDPLAVLGHLRFPLVLLCVYYSSVTFGSLYVLNISIQYTFEKAPYDFTTLIVGLLCKSAFLAEETRLTRDPDIPNSIGYILASQFGGRWMDKIMAREARKRQADSHDPYVLLPEDRMRENAWLGALIYPAALIWYGWTADFGVFWVAPVSTVSTMQLGSRPSSNNAGTILAID